MIEIEKNFDPKGLLKEAISSIEESKNGYRYSDLFKYLVTEKSDILGDLALIKMEDSLKKRDVTETDFLASGLFIIVSTIPYTIEEAKNRYYSKGYLNYLDNRIKLARGLYPSSHFFHIQFFGDGTLFWIEISFWPNSTMLDFSPTYYVPGELLTFEEKLKVGLIKTEKSTRWPHCWLRKIDMFRLRLLYRYTKDECM